MENKKKKEIPPEDKDLTGNAASAAECTGLMQQIPGTEEEYASFHDIFDFGPTDEDADDPFYGTDEEF